MTNEPSCTASSGPERGSAPRSLTFPKTRRLLRPAEFRQVYDSGERVPGRSFTAFFWRAPAPDGPRIGFTATRALGKAVARNRMRRRVREAVRRNLPRLSPYYRIVFNLRRAASQMPFAEIETEVTRLFDRCSA